MLRVARILPLMLTFEVLGCGGTPRSLAAAPASPMTAQLTLPDSCAWLDMKSALGTPAVAVKITGFCVHEEKDSVATETYEYKEGAKTALAVREVNERTLATRLKGTMIGPRGVDAPCGNTKPRTSHTDYRAESE